jgi:hypothetical protein
MVKKSIQFYIFLVVFLILSFVISFNYGLLIWYGISLIGNSLIIQKAINQNPTQKKTLIFISSIFILLPIIYILFLLFVLGGIEC